MVLFYKLISEVQHISDISLDVLPQMGMRNVYREWINMAKKSASEQKDAQKQLSLVVDKADLDFRNLTNMLGNIALVRMERDPFRVKYLIVGGELVSLYGQEISGFYVDELYGKAEQKEAMMIYQKVCDEKRPYYTEKTYRTMFRELGYNRLVLPITDGGNSIEYALTCIYSKNPSIKKASDWKYHDDIQYWAQKIDEESLSKDLSENEYQKNNEDFSGVSA